MALLAGTSPSARAGGRLPAAARVGLLAAAAWLLAGCGPQVRHSAITRVNGPEAREARRADALGLTSTGAQSSQPARVNDQARAYGEGAPSKPAPGEVAAPAGADGRWFGEV